MNRKKLGIGVFIISIGLFIFLIGQERKVSNMTIELTQLENIMKTHKETKEPLIQTLNLNGYETVYDQGSDSWYYSLIENHKSAFNPTVKYKARSEDVHVVFFDSEITDIRMEQNLPMKMIAYDDSDYHIYEIVCTNLPLLSITYNEKKQITQTEDTKIEITLFDNRKDATNRITTSIGEMHIRGATSVGYPKKGYKFTLFQETLGNNTRRNKVSLLGMRQDEEWVLYAGYNDQEKIRNVFSTNLWMDSCSKNNSLGIVNGVEYRYTELFINGEYHGLYALGYQLDPTQMQLTQDLTTGKNKEYIFKKIGWSSAEIEASTSKREILDGYELRGKNSDEKVAWAKLKKFYTKLTTSEDIEELYQLVDLQNSIDIYLFYNLVQGIDNIGETGQGLKNTFVTIKTKNGKDIVLYTPWDLDITFGNTWQNGTKNNTIAYGETYRRNYLMQLNIIKYLHQLKDKEINQKIVTRYQELRQNDWSDEKIEQQIDQYENSIYMSGAYRRDRDRWPDGSYMDPGSKLTEFKKYVLRRLQYMDIFIDGLDNGN